MKGKKRTPIAPERLAELRTMPYADYLKTPEWCRRRAVQLMLADHRCMLCNSPADLEVHHRSYANLGAEKRYDLIVLCGGENGCHRLFHRHRRLARPVEGQVRV